MASQIWVNTGSDNGLLLNQQQAITWTNADKLDFETHFNGMKFEIQTLSKCIGNQHFQNLIYFVQAPVCVNSLRPSDAYMRQYFYHN